MQGVFHSGFLFLEFRFGGRTDFDHRHAANQLGEALLELFAIIIAGRVFDLWRISCWRALIFDLSPAPSTMVVLSLVDLDVTRLTEIGIVTFPASGRAPRRSPAHPSRWRCLSVALLRRSPKPRCLHCGGAECTAELVHHERRERFAFDVFGNHQSGFCWRAITSSTGNKSFRLAIFFSLIRMYASSNETSKRSGSVTK